MSATAGTHGPAVLHLGVADLAVAATRLAALGATPLPGAAQPPQWWLPPGLVVTTHLDAVPGPRELVLRVASEAAVVDRARALGIAVEVTAAGVRITDERIASGALVCTAAAPDPAVPDPVAAAPAAPAPGDVGLRGTDHVAFVVADLDRAVALLRAAGGVPVLGGDGEVGARAVLLAFDRTKVELLAPNGPGPTRDVLCRWGGRAGLHHLTLFVADIPAAADGLRRRGLPTTGLDTTRRATWHEVYLAPRHSDRFLFQLAWTDQDHRTPLSDDVLAGVLRGAYDVTDYTLRTKQESQP